jgi:hypothetical protein
MRIEMVLDQPSSHPALATRHRPFRATLSDFTRRPALAIFSIVRFRARRGSRLRGQGRMAVAERLLTKKRPPGGDD